jgi:hypothetical protein
VKRRRVLLACLVVVLAAIGFHWWNRRQPVPPTEIYEGVTYGCASLAEDAEGSGLMHWVRIDLAAPDVEIYVTPLDPEAVADGWQYRLRNTGSVVREEGLAVGVNGTLFSADSGWLPRPGDLARAIETAVADHQVSHVVGHTFLLWFDDQKTPYVESSKPPSESVLTQARWGIGGKLVGLRGGQVDAGGSAQEASDSRTVVGFDRERRLLFLAVFQNASPRRALEELRDLGAVDGMLLDGGDSTSMALGNQARGVRPGVLMGGWRPVATHFGVRARALKTK